MNKTWIAEFSSKPGFSSQNTQSAAPTSMNGFVITAVSQLSLTGLCVTLVYIKEEKER